MVTGSRLGVTVAIIAALLVAAPPAGAAVKSGRYKGTDISFKVSNGQISKVKAVFTYSCQRIPTGQLPEGEVRQLTVPGSFKLSRQGTLVATRAIGNYGGIQGIFFGWKGRIRGGSAKFDAQSGYQYSYYSVSDGFLIVKCFSQVTYKAKRQ